MSYGDHHIRVVTCNTELKYQPITIHHGADHDSYPNSTDKRSSFISFIEGNSQAYQSSTSNTMSRNRNAVESPDADNMGDNIEDNQIPDEEFDMNDSTATTGVDGEHDSYMGNGADESGNVSASGSKSIPEGIVVRVLPTTEIDAGDVSDHASFTIKPDGKSYKYPELKKYYEFGPWVGRNRKAICVRCKHQSASSQPERLIKHMKRCPLLSDEDKSLADTLLLESTSNKRGRNSRSLRGDDSEYFADMEGPNNSAGGGSKSFSLPPMKRLKKYEVSDRKAQIDQALARWIVCCRIPLKSIHSKEFVEFVRGLDPDYRLPSRENITNVLIPSLLNIL